MDYIKGKVSNWVLVFDNGERVYLESIKNETLTFSANRTVEVVLKSYVISDTLINLIKSGRNLTDLLQAESYICLDNTKEDFTREISHKFMQISTVLIKNDEADEIMQVNMYG